MEQISYKLEFFEGPLDLLLHLISKHKLNINDIPIVTLLEQYLAYIDKMAEVNMEIAGEFLEMAARLIYIKTASLLPRHDEAEKLKIELQGRLIEYSLCKKAAELMRDKYTGMNITVRKPMQIEFDSTYSVIHDSDTLLTVYLSINVKPVDIPVKNEDFSGIVSGKIVSVTSKIIYVLRSLYKNGECSLDGLFNNMTGRSERVAVFLAVLELTKSGRILLNEDNTIVKFNSDYASRKDSDDVLD